MNVIDKLRIMNVIWHGLNNYNKKTNVIDRLGIMNVIGHGLNNYNKKTNVIGRMQNWHNECNWAWIKQFAGEDQCK